MMKTRKKKIKQIIALVCVAAVVLLLAAIPMIFKNKEEADGPKASILSGTVGLGSVNSKVIGGGTLAEEDAETVSLPASVKLTEYLVSNGDSVRTGDPIAAVDRVTLMTAIAEVQETLELLSERIKEESEKDTEENVTALAGGTVKMLYAKAGDSVQDVMLEHGSLAVLSLDGLMAVDLQTTAALSAGDAVTLMLADGSETTGKVESCLAGEVTVTVADDGYAQGDAVQIYGEDGALVGSGELYIYSPWNAIAYAGTVDSLKINEGDTISAGKTLMHLKNTGYTAAYHQLINQRQTYEELMLELFVMYQTELVNAPCDGVVSGIDTGSAQLLSADRGGYVVSLLANAPNGDDETLYTNYIGQITAVDESGWAVSMNPAPLEIADYMALAGLPTGTEAMTEQVTLAGGAPAPIYELQGNIWVQVDAASVSAGDILLFADDGNGGVVWIVRVIKAEMPTDPTEPAQPSDPTFPSDPSGSFTPGGLMQYGITEQEPEETMYALDTVDIAAVTPQDTVTLGISVSELDVSALHLGMSAEVMMDALGGEKFTATITDIGNTGTNSGGYSYFTVELTMDRSENMLAGMNATATVVIGSVENVLTIPAEALVEIGTRTVVYTGYDDETEELTGATDVIIGASDGKTVELLSGLKEGESYYYAYYDTMEISIEPEFGNRRGGRGGFSLFSLMR